MSDRMNEYNLDDILAEFSSYGEPEEPEVPKAEPLREVKSEPIQKRAERPVRREESIQPVKRERERPAPPVKRERQVKKAADNAPQEYFDEYEARKMERRRTASGPLRTVISMLFVPVVLLVLVWVGLNVHPDSGTVTASNAKKNTSLVRSMEVYLNNIKSEALSDLTYIRKIYTIPEEATAGPKPNPSGFGVTTNMAEVRAVVDAAADLLDGQPTVWNENLDFYPDNNVYYYRDSTILALVWRERINNRSCTIAEIKVADGSQLRRKLSEDTYGSSIQNYASSLSDSANAVAAMNADFYGFRQIGVTVYNRQLFRFSPDKLDNCFINSKGDMLFMRAGSITDEEQMRQYIAYNDVLFSLSFGPILVDNGELQYCESYPIGEMNLEYSRAGLGMVDELHYLYMTVNHCNGVNPRCNVNQFAELMFSKDCVKAYNLDGGQTSEIVFNGNPVNYIDFNAERTVTDIIYFATALPESEVSQ